MAFEFLSPSGDRRVFYRFSVLDAAGEEDFWYSLGSYDVTTAIARHTGEIGETDRLYHLDRYDEGSHHTLGFFKKAPGYDDIKQNVVAALKGSIKPFSSTTKRDSPAPN